MQQEQSQKCALCDINKCYINHDTKIQSEFCSRTCRNNSKDIDLKCLKNIRDSITKLKEYIITNLIQNLNNVETQTTNNLIVSLDILIRDSDSTQCNHQLDLLYLHKCIDNHYHIYTQIATNINFIITNLQSINKLLNLNKIINPIIRRDQPASLVQKLVQAHTKNLLPKIQATETNQPSKNNSCLDNYKIPGLKELCVQHNLNTSNCRLRADYIELLLRNNVVK